MNERTQNRSLRERYRLLVSILIIPLGAIIAARAFMFGMQGWTLVILGLAFVALGSFAHLTSRKAQQQALAAVRAHLNTGGTFIVDISNSDARYMENLSGQLLHQGTWRDDDGKFFTHMVSPASSHTKHLLELTHFYDRHVQGGPIERTVVTTYLYLFERSEMELLLEQAGFGIKEVYGDYTMSPATLESPRMIFIAEAR